MFTRHFLFGVLTTMCICCGEPDIGNFPGLYTGTVKYIITRPGDNPESSTHNDAVLTIVPGNMSDLAFDLGGVIGGPCIVDADINEDKANLRVGSQCVDADYPKVKLIFKNGTANLAGTTLRFSMNSDEIVTDANGKVTVAPVSGDFAGTKR